MSTAKLAMLAVATLLSLSGIKAAETLNEAFIAEEFQRTQSAPDSVATVTIAAPIDFVFEFLTTRPNDYTTDAVSVAFDHSQSDTPGKPGRGSIRTIGMENGESLVQRFLMLEAPATYGYLTDMEQSTVSLPLKYSITRYELTAAPNGSTELRVALVYQPSSRLLAFFVRRAFRSALQRDFEQAAEIIEAEWNAANAKP